MNKRIVSMAALSLSLAGSAYAMDDELTSMEGLIDDGQQIVTDENREQEKQERSVAISRAIVDRRKFANLCWEDDYRGVKEHLESHNDPIPAREYKISLISHLSTARMAVLLENRGHISLAGRDEYGSLLHWAARLNRTPMLLKYAIRRYCKEEKTLDVNEHRKIDGKTPLHKWADGVSWYSAKEILDALEKLHLLLDAGADCTLPDKRGIIPLDMLEQERDRHESLKNDRAIRVYNMLIADLKQTMATRKK